MRGVDDCGVDFQKPGPRDSRVIVARPMTTFATDAELAPVAEGDVSGGVDVCVVTAKAFPNVEFPLENADVLALLLADGQIPARRFVMRQPVFIILASP